MCISERPRDGLRNGLRKGRARRRGRGTRWVGFAALLGLTCTVGAAPPEAASPGLGEPLDGPDFVDFTVLPDGTGLPPGSGTAAAGEALYLRHCAACHGAQGVDGPNDPLAGGIGSLASDDPRKTVGSYWPYATTLFDYLRRAMPYQAPGSLTDDELYALTAYVLYLNGIVERDASLSARSLPAVQMPNRQGFDRAWPAATGSGGVAAERPGDD